MFVLSIIFRFLLCEPASLNFYPWRKVPSIELFCTIGSKLRTGQR